MEVAISLTLMAIFDKELTFEAMSGVIFCRMY